MSIGMANKKSSDFSTEKPTDSEAWDLHYLELSQETKDFLRAIELINKMTFTGIVIPSDYLTEFEIIYLPPSIGHDSALEKGLEE